jgi:hypothetical protein
VAYEASSDAYFDLRVTTFIEVDSVVPGTIVPWGAKVTAFGVGLRFFNLIAAGGAPLLPDTFTFVDSLGLQHMEYWVQQPARTGALRAAGPGFSFDLSDSIVVDTVDLYEPNDTFPALLSLTGPGPYPTVFPTLKFFNPALAFEEPDRSIGTGFEWYRFDRPDTTTAVTFIISPRGLLDSTGVFLVFSDSIGYSGFHFPGLPSWFLTTQGGNHCPRGSIFPNQRTADSMIVALRRLTGLTPNPTALHVLSFYQTRQPYAIVAIDDYLTSKPGVDADRFEENDVCNFADDNFATLPVVLSVPTPTFTDTLTIDNPHDPDWIRFRVLTAVAVNVTIKTSGRPLPGEPFDPSDIDLYVLGVSPFSQLGSVSSVGSRESLTVNLNPGDYYLFVVDYQGEPTRYGVCITLNADCTPPTAAGAAGAGALRSREDVNGPAGAALRAPRQWAVPAGAPTPAGANPFRRP